MHLLLSTFCLITLKSGPITRFELWSSFCTYYEEKIMMFQEEQDEKVKCGKKCVAVFDSTIFDSDYRSWLWLPYFTLITVFISDYHIWLCLPNLTLPYLTLCSHIDYHIFLCHFGALELPYLTLITMFNSDYHIWLRLPYFTQITVTQITIFDSELSYLTLITIWPTLLYLTQITIFDSDHCIWLRLPYLTLITVFTSSIFDSD